LPVRAPANALLRVLLPALDDECCAEPTLFRRTFTMKKLLQFVREDDGQDLVEYALLITFIALACIVGMQQLGTAINNKYQSISTSLAS
jgi:Flp pilus assembly pilin Flp